jgi:hypothetical protein
MSVPTTTPSPPRLFARNTCDWVYLMTERGRGRGVCRFLAAGLEVSAVKSVSNLPYSPPSYPPPPRFFARAITYLTHKIISSILLIDRGSRK